MLALDGAVPAGWVRSRQDGCAKPMIGYGIGSRSDDLQPRNKKKKDKRVAGPIGGGGDSDSGTREFCTPVKRQGRTIRCQVGIKTLRLRLYGMRRAQGHGPTEPVAG